MANPTTNFGWVMPTSSSLVTNLPADFNTFGQAVDTSMSELLGGTTGQVLSKTSNTNMDFTWVTPQTGDITGVTAGVGISGGGTSGDVTVTNSMATAITTAGDLIKGTGSGTFDRLGIGSSGQVLTVSSGVPAWITPAGGGSMTSIATGTLSNQQLSITSISGSYQRLVFVLSNLTAAANYDLAIRFNGDTGSNYGRGLFRVDSTNTNNGTPTGWDERIYFNSNVVSSGTVATLMLDIPFYALANTRHLGSGGAGFLNGSNSKYEMFAGQFLWNSTSAITSITTTASNLSGTYTLYGVN